MPSLQPACFQCSQGRAPSSGALYLVCVFLSGEGLGGHVASWRQDTSGNRKTCWRMAIQECGPCMALLGFVLGFWGQGPVHIVSPVPEQTTHSGLSHPEQLVV